MTHGPLSKSDPRSIFNLSPRELQVFLDAHVTELDLEQTEESYVTTHGITPDPLVNRIRIEFWREYDRAQSQLRKIELSNIALGTGTPTNRVLSLLSKRHNICWVLIPPGTYENFLDEALQFGLTRLRKDILGANLYTTVIDKAGDAHTVMDHKAAELLLKAVAFLDMRKHGGIVSKNLHVIKSANDLKGVIPSMTSIEDIDKRIKELEQKGIVDHAMGVLDTVTVIPYPTHPSDNPTPTNPSSPGRHPSFLLLSDLPQSTHLQPTHPTQPTQPTQPTRQLRVVTPPIVYDAGVGETLFTPPSRPAKPTVITTTNDNTTDIDIED